MPGDGDGEPLLSVSHIPADDVYFFSCFLCLSRLSLLTAGGPTSKKPKSIRRIASRIWKMWAKEFFSLSLTVASSLQMLYNPPAQSFREIIFALRLSLSLRSPFPTLVTHRQSMTLFSQVILISFPVAFDPSDAPDVNPAPIRQPREGNFCRSLTSIGIFAVSSLFSVIYSNWDDCTHAASSSGSRKE